MNGAARRIRRQRQAMRVRNKSSQRAASTARTRERKQRLDLLLAERGLAESRQKAQALILAGKMVTMSNRMARPDGCGSALSLGGQPALNRGFYTASRIV